MRAGRQTLVDLCSTGLADKAPTEQTIPWSTVHVPASAHECFNDCATMSAHALPVLLTGLAGITRRCCTTAGQLRLLWRSRPACYSARASGRHRMHKAAPDEATDLDGALPFAELGTAGSASGAVFCKSGQNADSGKKKRKVALHLAYVGSAFKGVLLAVPSAAVSCCALHAQAQAAEHSGQPLCSAGLQLQRVEGEASTVEGVLETALFRAGSILQSNLGALGKIGWTRSSRTDKGVHSLATVRTRWTLPKHLHHCVARRGCGSPCIYSADTQLWLGVAELAAAPWRLQVVFPCQWACVQVVACKLEVDVGAFEGDSEGLQLADSINGHMPAEVTLQCCSAAHLSGAPGKVT